MENRIVVRQSDVEAVLELAESHAREMGEWKAEALLCAREILKRGEPASDTERWHTECAEKVASDFDHFLRTGEHIHPFAWFALPLVDTDEDLRQREEYLARRAACGNGPPATD